MSHEQIWAPWRHAYIKNPKRENQPGCFLCQYRDENRDADNFVVARGASTLVVLNRFPYNNGHLLVAPLEHKGGFEELTDAEHLECMQQIDRMIGVFRRILNPEGFNVGLNLGKAAGAGLPGHLHWHLVPRWTGDTNFMPVLAGVDLIGQSLESLYAAIQEALSAD